MSDVPLIEKLINFLKTSAVSPANQTALPSPETKRASVLMAGDAMLGYLGTFGH